MDLNEHQLATVLAALRQRQQQMRLQYPIPCYDHDLDAISTDDGRLKPLSDIEIDWLCEKLNFAAECVKKDIGKPVVATDKCAWDGCLRPATDVAVGCEAGFKKPASYCEVHADTVSRQGSPEYLCVCPNCACQFGKN